MTTLAEIEAAAATLPKEEQKRLLQWLREEVHGLKSLKSMHDEKGRIIAPEERRHSVLDIKPVDLGEILRPFGPDDDFLGEMLEEDRRFDPRT